MGRYCLKDKGMIGVYAHRETPTGNTIYMTGLAVSGGGYACICKKESLLTSGQAAHGKADDN